jgi:hypothetical protein
MLVGEPLITLHREACYVQAFENPILLQPSPKAHSGHVTYVAVAIETSHWNRARYYQHHNQCIEH